MKMPCFRSQDTVILTFFTLAGWLAMAAAQTNVVVAFTTTNSTPLHIGYAGFTTELLGTGIEYGDTKMQQAAAQLSPGWLLYPAGTTGDAFNWQTCLTDSNWVNTVGQRQGPNRTASNLCAVTISRES